MDCSLYVAFLVVVLILALPSNTSQAAQATKRGGGAPELILLNLLGRNGDRISLAVQTHDLSLAGFANRSYHWYTFPGYKHVILNGTTLPFGNSYRDLVGGLANLRSLPLGRDPVLRALGTISVCDDPASADDGDLVALKRALATLTVTKCEALRLTPIRELVSDAWESGEARLTEDHLRYIEHWDTMSFEIDRAHGTGQWNGPFTDMLRKSANIHSEEEALAVVNVMADRTFDQVLMAHARSSA